MHLNKAQPVIFAHFSPASLGTMLPQNPWILNCAAALPFHKCCMGKPLPLAEDSWLHIGYVENCTDLLCPKQLQPPLHPHQGDTKNQCHDRAQQVWVSLVMKNQVPGGLPVCSLCDPHTMCLGCYRSEDVIIQAMLSSQSGSKSSLAGEERGLEH
jgi:hypothetical protein